jgi:hypothetical protein
MWLQQRCFWVWDFSKQIHAGFTGLWRQYVPYYEQVHLNTDKIILPAHEQCEWSFVLIEMCGCIWTQNPGLWVIYFIFPFSLYPTDVKG